MYVYGELRRHPLYVNTCRYERIVTYWLTVVNSENIIIQTVYNQDKNYFDKGHTNWVSTVTKLFNDYGFSYIHVFQHKNMINTKSFYCELKRRITNTFNQKWFGNMNNSSGLDMYRIFKTAIEYETFRGI